jgi:dynein intermediate chain 3, axonemal
MADEGLMPLFITGASQAIFGCVVDQDVTPESPRKLVPLEKIHQDFRDRAAVSDFHPCKAQMLVSAVTYRTTGPPARGFCWTTYMYICALAENTVAPDLWQGQAYTGTEVLVVFDPDFKYGQNFFVLLTEEAKNNWIAVCTQGYWLGAYGSE